MIRPTSSQMEAIVDIASADRPVTRLHGYAGTGKTSVVATQAIAALERQGVSVQVLAPTGKAARVLRSKGLHGAATIHSYLYTPSKRERLAWRESWDEFVTRVDAAKPKLLPLLAAIDTAAPETPVDDEWDQIAAKLPKKLAEQAKALREARRFELAFNAAGAIAHYEESGYPACEVLLIDEASMVSDQVASDLLRTGSRLVFVGDPAQLPPVKAQRSLQAMGAPHHLLTKVHRQAGGSPVLELATEIRKSIVPEVPLTKPKRLLALEDYDQVLCWRNATRERVNAEIRRRLGRRDPMMPEHGDRLICIKNTKPKDEEIRQWMNGEQVTVLDAQRSGGKDSGTLALTVMDDDGIEHEVFSPAETFAGHKAEQAFLDRSMWGSPDPAWAFGFAITVHKSQGSEWGNLLLVDESSDMISLTARREGRAAAIDQARQWLYTAVTRARDRVDVVRSIHGV
ncbi:DNA helicase [Microbacterium phage FuzzBuster]|uniref:DNA helicase n=1 Tax=Microbacterium phage FuzzBuster TaxID=2590935 RepID=A0A516KV45_9CAUD|nr:DNA helicase [Microbacterium phage FuzzBuster]